MATVPETETDRRTHFGPEAKAALHVVVTGSLAIPLRTLVLFVAIGVFLTYAPQPFAAIGIGAVIAMALEWGRKR